MVEVHLEVERAFEPADDLQVPDLTELPGVARIEVGDTADLEAAYCDTADLALLRAGVTVRRRRGGADEGWHLKVPSGVGRDEVRVPLGAGTRVPVGLRRLVLGWTRGERLGAVATITTRRTVHRLLDENGSVLAELADDHVTGRQLGAADPVIWREWELELVDGNADSALLDEAERLLEGVGVPSSRHQRKLDRVLEGRLPDRTTPGKVGKDQPAGRVLHHRLREQVESLLRSDFAIRRDEAEGVHELRKACRRMRSALATCRPLVDRRQTDPIREELRWLARALGGARDGHVTYAHLEKQVSRMAPDLVVGPVRRRMARARRADDRAGRRTALDVLGSARYFDLLRRLERLVEDPPWTDTADEAAEDVLPGRVRKDWKRLRERHRRAKELADGPDLAAYDEALHAVRRAAKRLRYAGELTEAVWGSDADRMRKKAKRLTQVLGDRQDSTVIRQTLENLSREATEAGESAFTYGHLHAQEEARARAAGDDYAKAWKSLKRKKVRAWLG